MTMIISGSGGATFPDSTTQTTAASLATPLVVTGNSTSGAEIRLPEDTDNGSNYVALKAADSIATNLTLTLPAADGTSGQLLSTNGSGTLSWSTVSGGPNIQTFTSSGTWTKPAGASVCFVIAWGAGGSGGVFDQGSNKNAGGGGGGACVMAWLPASSFGSTETITIGAGGPAQTGWTNGINGGNTTVGSLITAYGGGGGGAQNSSNDAGNGGSGGGLLSAGTNGGGVSSNLGGKPYCNSTTNSSTYMADGWLDNPGFGGGSVYYGGSNNGGNSAYGGGAGGFASAGNGGNSVYGGGGGSGAQNSATGTAGTSLFGGNGGTGARGSSATAGTQPGGGGGGATSNSGTVSSGKGGDGKVIIYTWS